MESPKKTFEEAIARLEEIVAALEAGETPLEESMALFEEGIALVRFCQGQLSAAEGRLEILMAGGEAPFQPEGGSGYGGASGS